MKTNLIRTYTKLTTREFYLFSNKLAVAYE